VTQAEEDHGSLDVARQDLALAVCGVSKTFRTDSGAAVGALDGVDLTVRRGEFIVLIGPTGCGKTTLLDIIGGLRMPDRGHVRFGDGINRHGGLAYVFQHYTLFPWRRLLRNVEFGLEMRGVARHQRRSLARKLLADMGLDAFENAFPHELSGGMRQRAAIAQALAIEPCILLLDEPFGALDDATRHDLQRRIIDLWQASQRTVLFVTRNIDEAVAMATRIVVFSASPGNVVREIPVDLPRPRDRLSTPFTEVYFDVRRAFYAGAGQGNATR
jgi:NitT/TauT family transport system ATP-binding protein